MKFQKMMIVPELIQPEEDRIERFRRHLVQILDFIGPSRRAIITFKGSVIPTTLTLDDEYNCYGRVPLCTSLITTEPYIMSGDICFGDILPGGPVEHDGDEDSEDGTCTHVLEAEILEPLWATGDFGPQDFGYILY